MNKYFCLGCFFILTQYLYSQQSSLSIKIEGIKEVKGIIQVGIYDEKDTFPNKGKEYRVEHFRVTSRESTVTLEYLPNGEYSIALYQDLNSDGECNVNFISIPKEPYGFSNNVKPVFKAPTFEQTKFVLNSDRTIQIELID